MSPLAIRRRVGSFMGLLLLLSPLAAYAQDQRAVLEIVVNEVAAGETIVTLRGTDALVSVAALTGAGLQNFAGTRVNVGGQELVSLASLAPGVSFEIDEVRLQVRLTATTDFLRERVRNLFTGAPADLVYRSDNSGFLNYSVNYNSADRLSVFAESAATLKGALFYNTFTSTNEHTIRGLTSVSIDQRSRLRRWTFGDSFGYTGALGGDAWLAGITVAKEFAIDPYFVRFPMLSLSTPITVPSVMEVLVNGQIVSQEQVAPGRVDIQNLPLTLGRNDARVIVRDAFGVTRELTSNFYLTTTALAKGVQDYQYSVGFQRMGVSMRSWDYRTPVALVRHRVGLTNVLTTGGRFEVRPGQLFNGGPSVNIRLPFGEIEAAGAASRRDDLWGQATQVGFTYASRPVSAGGSVMVASRNYASLTVNLPGEDPATQTSAFASVSMIDPVSVTIQHTLTKMHQGLTRSRAGLLTNFRLRRNMELSASVSEVRDENGRGREVYAGVTVLFGRASASVSHIRDSRSQRVAVDAQQSLPLGTGYGYQVRAESGQRGTVSGVAQYQNQYGRYEVRQESFAGQSNTTVTAMGSIVGIGGGLYAARPVRDSFALVRVPGVEGVRAFASHQEVGRTGRNGNVLVPDLQAYYGNLLNIADTDVPLTYAVPKSNITLAPPYRGGALALFEVQQVRQVVGRVQIVESGVERTPEYGQLTVTVDNVALESPLGTTGNFYFENLPAGHHSAVVEDRKGSCSFVLEVASSAEPVMNLGVLRCAVRGGQ